MDVFLWEELDQALKHGVLSVQAKISHVKMIYDVHEAAKSI